MKLCIISFTENGKQLSQKIAGQAKETEIKLFTKHKADTEYKTNAGYKTNTEYETSAEYREITFVEIPVGEWAGEQMRERNGMLFIGSCGIAVRAIAPYVKNKQKDAPVLVMDEKGRYVIPILSGHIGGANELALYLAEKTGAEPVITTATDINGKFAADLFAKENGLSIVNKDGIAKVSAKVLDGKEITVSVSPEVENNSLAGFKEDNSPEVKAVVSGTNAAWVQGLPAGVRVTPYSPDEPVDILITSGEEASNAALILRPKEYVIGIGCKKGKPEAEIREFILKKTEELGISRTQIYAVSSIINKREEPGIVAWCRKEAVPFFTYTAEELQEVKGDFTDSSFVKAQVGVDNVCERAAVKACGAGGRLVAGKCAKDGMTIAVAKRKWGV